MINNQPKLLTDILNHLAQSEEARERFNQNKICYVQLQHPMRESKELHFCVGINFDHAVTLQDVLFNQNNAFYKLCEETPKTLADKLIQQATTLYFKDPQALADDICKAINNNF